MSSEKWQLLLPNGERLLTLLTENWGHFAYHWWATFSVSSTASLLALVAALSLSVFALKIRFFRILMSPVVALSQSFPLQAIAPLIIMVLGVGFLTKSVIAFLIAFFPLYNACIISLQTTPKPLLAKLSICRAPFTSGVFLVRLPASLPNILAATKVGFTLAVLGAVVAEFIQPDKGLGYLLLIAQASYDVEVIFIAVGMLMIQGVTVFSILTFFEARLVEERSYA